MNKFRRQTGGSSMGSTSIAIALCVLLSKKFKPKQKQLIFHLRKSPTIWRRVYVSLSLIRTTCTRPIKRNDESGARSHALSFTRLIIQQTITKCSIRFNISNELETKFVTNADSKFWSFEKDKKKVKRYLVLVEVLFHGLRVAGSGGERRFRPRPRSPGCRASELFPGQVVDQLQPEVATFRRRRLGFLWRPSCRRCRHSLRRGLMILLPFWLKHKCHNLNWGRRFDFCRVLGFFFVFHAQ